MPKTKTKEISLEEMREFLQRHYQYHLMNRWNKLTSYAHKVKIHSFVPRNLQDAAYKLIDSEMANDLYYEMRNLLDVKTGGYYLGFNGRSGGYLVLMPKKGNNYGSMDRRGVDFSSDEWNASEIDEEYSLVQKFDEVVETYKRRFLELCADESSVKQAEEDEKNSKIREVRIIVKGGVAYAEQVPTGISVLIIDEDNQGPGPSVQEVHYENGIGLVFNEG